MEYWTKCLKSLCYANKARMMGDIISPTDKNIALLALLIFYTISSSPAERALLWNGGRGLKKEHNPCFHLQTQAANEDTATCTAPQIQDLPTHATSKGHPASLFLLRVAIPRDIRSKFCDYTLTHPKCLQQQVQLNHLQCKISNNSLQFTA